MEHGIEHAGLFKLVIDHDCTEARPRLGEHPDPKPGAWRNGQAELEQARYDAHLAARRYEAVDPANRLGAVELERRWNARMEQVSALERRLECEVSDIKPEVIPDKELLLSLAQDLPAVWNSPAADMRLKQRIAAYRYIHQLQPDDPTGTHSDALTMEQVADRLGISTTAVRHMIERKAIPATQIVPCASWQIVPDALDSAAVGAAVETIKRSRAVPHDHNSIEDGSLSFEFGSSAD